MNYTVGTLAKISGVTVRTLHHYDEIGLLKPSYIADNGYRYYQKEQLFVLQQILFYKELGFELKQIQEILSKKDFDTIEALLSHKKLLLKKAFRTKELIKTIDKTVDHLERKKIMNEQEIFGGFDKEKQAEHEKQLIERWGKKAEERIAESYKNIKGWKKEDWTKSNTEFDAICKELTALLVKKVSVSSPEVQRIIARHHTWLKRFWTPNKESYSGLAQGYTEPEFAAVFMAYHSELAQYLADAMKLFAKENLK